MPKVLLATPPSNLRKTQTHRCIRHSSTWRSSSKFSLVTTKVMEQGGDPKPKTCTHTRQSHCLISTPAPWVSTHSILTKWNNRDSDAPSSSRWKTRLTKTTRESRNKRTLNWLRTMECSCSRRSRPPLRRLTTKTRLRMRSKSKSRHAATLITWRAVGGK